LGNILSESDKRARKLREVGKCIAIGIAGLALTIFLFSVLPKSSPDSRPAVQSSPKMVSTGNSSVVKCAGKPDFRYACWYMNKATVMQLESENSGRLFDPAVCVMTGERFVNYGSRLLNIPCEIRYNFFKGDSLTTASYNFGPEYATNSDYIAFYDQLRDYLIESYGEPDKSDTIWTYPEGKGNRIEWGDAIAQDRMHMESIWYTDRTRIYLNVYSNGSRGIILSVDYFCRREGRLVKDTVLRVINGNAFLVPDSCEVGLLGVDPPNGNKSDKSAKNFAQESEKFLESLIEGKIIEYEADLHFTNQPAQLFGYIWVDDSILVNRTMIEHGYAFADRKKSYISRKSFIAAENQAKQKHLGLWANKGGKETGKQ